jgi:ribosomal protein RSM22 (predicted rRNA methylase)
MKKILNLPIAILLLSSLVSCGNSNPPPKTPEKEREESINAEMDKFFQFILSEMKVSASPDVQKNLKTAMNKIVNTLIKEKEAITKFIKIINSDFTTFQKKVNTFTKDGSTQNFLNSLLEKIKTLTPKEITSFSQHLSTYLKSLIPSNTQNNEKIDYTKMIADLVNSLNSVDANFKGNLKNLRFYTKIFIHSIFKNAMKPEYKSITTSIENIIETTFNDAETTTYFNQIIEFITTPSTIETIINEKLIIIKKNAFEDAKENNLFLKAFFTSEQNTQNQEQSNKN